MKTQFERTREGLGAALRPTAGFGAILVAISLGVSVHGDTLQIPNPAETRSVVATESVVAPAFLSRAASSWTYKTADKCWDNYSWLNPRDWWPYRDFHLAFSWPAGKREVQIRFLTQRAWNTYKKAKLTGGVPSPIRRGNTVRWEITAGHRARSEGPYGWRDDACVWGREVRICYR